MKEARMHLYIGDVISLQGELSFEQKSTFIHETIAPLMYQVNRQSDLIIWVKSRSILQKLAV